MNATAVLVFGYPGSGKGTTLDVAEEHGLATITMGDVVREQTKQAYSIDGTGEDINTLDNTIVGEYATTMRDIHDDDVMAHLTVQQIKNTNLANEDVIVVDGLRSIAEYTVFKQHFESVSSVFVQAAFDTRLERLRERGRDTTEKTLTAEQLRERDRREESWGLKEVVVENHYDQQITNESSLAEFKTQMKQVLTEIVDSNVSHQQPNQCS